MAEEKPVNVSEEAADAHAAAERGELPDAPVAEEGAPKDESPESGPDSAELDALQEKVEAAAKREADLTDRLQRLQADFDNFRRRTQEQAGQASAKGRRDLLEALLPVLDNLDQALRHVEDQGLRLIGRQLTETLAQQGVQTVEPEPGAAFDAATQEAIAEEAAEGVPKGAVVKVFQRGYVVDGRVVRPARVVVAA